MTAAFICPACGAGSHNPNDIEYQYCGRCHTFPENRASPPEVIEGYAVQRWWPDGRVTAVLVTIEQTGQVILGDRTTVTDRWSYDTLMIAIFEWERWDPAKAKEPLGWIRHQPSNRRRPGGDATKEYVAP